MNVLVLGSSHIRRLHNYIDRFANLTNFDLDGQISVNYFGISGGRITNSEHCYRWDWSVVSINPEHVVVQLGGNDLDVVKADKESAEEIVLKIIAFCHTFISRHKVQHVTILQFLNRQSTRHVPPDTYNKLIKYANEYLKSELSSYPCLHYWNLKGLKHSESQTLVDGVHFNDLGNHKYFKNIRGAIIQSLHAGNNNC